MGSWEHRVRIMCIYTYIYIDWRVCAYIYIYTHMAVSLATTGAQGSGFRGAKRICFSYLKTQTLKLAALDTKGVLEKLRRWDPKSA